MFTSAQGWAQPAVADLAFLGGIEGGLLCTLKHGGGGASPMALLHASPENGFKNPHEDKQGNKENA